MVLLSSIITRSGDRGKTSLGDGSRISKNSLRIHAIGNVDELNAVIGILCEKTSNEISQKLRQVQNDLFDIGADLCVIKKENKLKITQKYFEKIEKWAEKYNNSLTPLTSFILPGGSEAASICHHARAVTRRVERSLVELHEKENINLNTVIYLNRLSDFLFILARFLNQNLNVKDVLWAPNSP